MDAHHWYVCPFVCKCNEYNYQSGNFVCDCNQGAYADTLANMVDLLLISESSNESLSKSIAI